MFEAGSGARARSWEWGSIASRRRSFKMETLRHINGVSELLVLVSAGPLHLRSINGGGPGKRNGMRLSDDTDDKEKSFHQVKLGD